MLLGLRRLLWRAFSPLFHFEQYAELSYLFAYPPNLPATSLTSPSIDNVSRCRPTSRRSPPANAAAASASVSGARPTSACNAASCSTAVDGHCTSAVGATPSTTSGAGRFNSATCPGANRGI